MTRTPDSPKAGDPQPPEKPKPAAGSSAKRQGKDFGQEGTNKTVSVPQDHATPADELQGTESKFIPKSPYTRG